MAQSEFSNSQVVIRRAGMADTEQLRACIEDAYAVYRGKIRGLPDVSEGVDRAIVNNIVWVAVVDKRVIAGLILEVQQKLARLQNIAVHRNFSGRGIAGRLIGVCENYCRIRGCVAIELNTHSQMPGNISLYQHLGWELTGTKDATRSMSKSL